MFGVSSGNSNQVYKYGFMERRYIDEMFFESNKLYSQVFSSSAYPFLRLPNYINANESVLSKSTTYCHKRPFSISFKQVNKPDHSFNLNKSNNASLYPYHPFTLSIPALHPLFLIRPLSPKEPRTLFSIPCPCSSLEPHT